MNLRLAMEDRAYPALYRAADHAAIKAQGRYLLAVRIYSMFLIAAAGLGAYGIKDAKAAIAAAIFIIGSILVSLWMLLKKDEDMWYRSRAVAESVKTSTWRFMMRADPFDDKYRIEDVKSRFRDRLRRILSEHKDLALAIAGDISREEQVTDRMCAIRNLPLDKRVAFYRQYRIDEQRAWYARKSATNSQQGVVWFGVLIVCQCVAIVLVIMRVAYPTWPYWPTEVFIVGAGSALTWMQVKRYRELAAAYGLTAHELGVIRGDLELVSDEADFAQFVSDSESAFSREHTQWLARKDEI